MTIDGRELLSFGGCNYLGLAQHPAVLGAVREGLSRTGLSTTASRETTGNTLAHEALERELARWLEQEACILTAEGYTANIAACQALAREIGVAIIDQRSHRSVRDAAVASGMQVFEFEHLSPGSAAWLIRQHADAGVALMTDSVFAADGAVAPLEEMLALLPARRGVLVVDDCHGLGVLGKAGRGAVSHVGLRDERIVITTTLAKGVGCYGGAVLGSRELVEKVRARSWVYRNSTPIPPPLAEAARAAIGVVSGEDGRAGGLVDRLRRNVGRMRGALGGLGLRLPPEGIPIFTFVVEPAERMERVHGRLLESGILAPLIEYPGGPGPRYFRIVVSAVHEDADIDRLGVELGRALAR